MSPLRCFVFALCLALVAPLFGAAPPPRPGPPFITLRARSAEDLVAAVRHLAGLYDPDAGTKAIDKELTNFTGKQPLAKIIPPGKPLLHYSAWPTSEKDFDLGVFVIPVTDPALFRAALSRYYGFTIPVGGGTWRSAPLLGSASPVFLRFAEGHVYLAGNRERLRGFLPAPAELAAGMDRGNLGEAVLHVAAMPAASRKELVGDFSFSEEDLKPEPGESDSTNRLRRAWMTGSLGWVKTAFQDTHEVRLGMRFDAKTDRLSGKVVLKTVPGSPLRKGFARLNRPASATAALLDRPGVGLGIQLPLFELLPGKAALQAVKEMAEQTVAPRDKLFFRRLIRAIEPTVEDGLFEVAVRQSTEAQSEGVLLAVRLKKVRELENLVRDYSKDMLPADRQATPVRWNHARESGVGIHRVTLKDRIDLPGGEIYLAFHKDIALFSTHLAAVRSAISDLNKKPPPGQPFRFRAMSSNIAFVALMAATLREDPKWWQALSAAQTQQDAVDAFVRAMQKKTGAKLTAVMDKLRESDRDGLDIRLEGGDELRLSIQLDARLLALVRALGQGEPMK